MGIESARGDSMNRLNELASHDLDDRLSLQLTHASGPRHGEEETLSLIGFMVPAPNRREPRRVAEHAKILHDTDPGIAATPLNC